jgi:hypothetical protein
MPHKCTDWQEITRFIAALFCHAAGSDTYPSLRVSISSAATEIPEAVR